MNMSLKIDDVIYIHGFKEEEPNFYCLQHFKDLIGFPTRVFLIRNDIIYVTHPTLDVVPLSDNCVDYEVLEDVDVGYHRQLKDKLQMLKQFGAKSVPIDMVKKIFKPKLKEQEEPKKSSRDETILDLVDKFNNNEVDLDFLNSFVGGLDNFINILSKKGWLHLINPFAEGAKEIQNSLFYVFYKNDKNFVWKIVDNFLSDIVKIDGEYYYDTTSGELSEYFYQGRNDVSQETIKSILDFDYNQDWYGDLTNDEYGDVYSDLTPENKDIVDQEIIKELKSMGRLDNNRWSSDLIGKIATEQGHEDYVELNDEVIMRIIKDDKSLKYLINQELDDVRTNLYNIYSMCYTDTLTDEWHDDIMNGLVGFVIDEPTMEEYEYKKHGWDKDGNRAVKTAYGKRYKATKAVYDKVVTWLESNHKHDNEYDDTIEYLGSFYNLMKDMIDDGDVDQLRINLSEYPDYRKIHNCINDNVTSYF
jgi:hypothetical protein